MSGAGEREQEVVKVWGKCSECHVRCGNCGKVPAVSGTVYQLQMDDLEPEVAETLRSLHPPDEPEDDTDDASREASERDSCM